MQNDIEIIKEVIDEISDEISGMNDRMARLEKGQEQVITTLDLILKKFSDRQEEDAATTFLLEEHGRRIISLETAMG